MQVSILAASRASLREINEVIETAKGGLGYDPGYLAAALPLLRVDDSYLLVNQYFEAHVTGRIAGFAAVKPLESGVVLLDHLWVAPALQRRGIGRQLLAACIEVSRGRARILRLYADPSSEAFYLQHGASRVGERPSRVPAGPRFPVLEFA